MASTTGLAATTVQTHSAESDNATSLSNRGGPRNRNRNRNRYGNPEGNSASHQGENRARNRNRNQGHHTSETPRSRGSGRSRGQGDFGMHQMSLEDRNARGKTDSSTDLSPSPAGGSSSRGHLTIDVTTLQGEALAKENRSEDERDEEADVCFICASSVVHGSVAPCNHRTCHICALRLRALYKTTACAHCRVSNTPRHFKRKVLRLSSQKPSM